MDLGEIAIRNPTLSLKDKIFKNKTKGKRREERSGEKRRGGDGKGEAEMEKERRLEVGRGGRGTKKGHVGSSCIETCRI